MESEEENQNCQDFLTWLQNFSSEEHNIEKNDENCGRQQFSFHQMQHPQNDWSSPLLQPDAHDIIYDEENLSPLLPPSMTPAVDFAAISMSPIANIKNPRSPVVIPSFEISPLPPSYLGELSLSGEPVMNDTYLQISMSNSSCSSSSSSSSNNTTNGTEMTVRAKKKSSLPYPAPPTRKTTPQKRNSTRIRTHNSPEYPSSESSSPASSTIQSSPMYSPSVYSVMSPNLMPSPALNPHQKMILPATFSTIPSALPLDVELPMSHGPAILPKPATPTTIMSPLLNPNSEATKQALQTEVAIRLAKKSNYQNILAGETEIKLWTRNISWSRAEEGYS